MFGIGTTEFLLIMVIALIVLGPEKLPQIARSVGKGLSELKRMSTELQRTINLEVERQEHQERVKEAEKELFGEKKDEAQAEAPQADAPKTDDQRAAEQMATEKAYASAVAANTAPAAEETQQTPTSPDAAGAQLTASASNKDVTA